MNDFVEMVVPELQRRGRFRESYDEGETLRERFFGVGHRRLPGNMYGASFRPSIVALADAGAPLATP